MLSRKPEIARETRTQYGRGLRRDVRDLVSRYKSYEAVLFLKKDKSDTPNAYGKSDIPVSILLYPDRPDSCTYRRTIRDSWHTYLMGRLGYVG